MAFRQVGKLNEYGLPFFMCVSTDTKPETGKNIVDGAVALETDTNNTYIFDATEWVLI